MRTRMTTSKLLRAFFYFSLPILVFAASDCPPGQTEILGKCYYFSDATELATHGNAMAACEAMGSKLFEPRSGDEYNAVTDQGLGEPGEYWLGLTRDNSQGQEEFKYDSDDTDKSPEVSQRLDSHPVTDEHRYICQGPELITNNYPGFKLLSLGETDGIVVDPDNPSTCTTSFPKPPESMIRATGSYVPPTASGNGGYLMVCGGAAGNDNVISDQCHFLLDDDIASGWQTSGKTMSTGRAYAASVQYGNSGSLWITGGQVTWSRNGFTDPVDTTVLVNSDGTFEENIASLPSEATGHYGHCMTLLDDETIMLLGGGITIYIRTDKTHLYDIPSRSWTSGSEMKMTRIFFACGSLIDQDDGKLRVFVIGGKYPGGLDPELYDPTTDTWQDVAIPNLPVELAFSTGVTSEDRSAMFVVGGLKSDVYTFQCSGGGCSTMTMTQNVAFPSATKLYHTLVLVPSNYASCEPKMTTTTP